MRITEAVLVGLISWLVTGAARGEGFHVESVTGQASYVAPQNGTPVALMPNTDLKAGDVLTDSATSIYVSPAPGSEFRLAPDSEMRIKGDDLETQPGEKPERKAALMLMQGKLTGSINPDAAGTCRYEIALSGGRILAENGMFVICVHGDGAHVYVARGYVTLYPAKGQYKETGIRLVAKASIGILGNEGEVSFQRMTQVASGMSNCLLSGLAPEVVEHLQMEMGAPKPYKFPNPVNRTGNPPVSAFE